MIDRPEDIGRKAMMLEAKIEAGEISREDYVRAMSAVAARRDRMLARLFLVLLLLASVCVAGLVYLS